MTFGLKYTLKIADSRLGVADLRLGVNDVATVNQSYAWA
jgi:hypothetical protein